MLTWRTLKHELAREVATQSRGARQKPPDHEVGNTVRNDRDVDDASPPAHTKGTRDAGETASKAPSVKARIGMRTSRWPTLPRQHSRHSRVPHAHKRAARIRMGTELYG